MTSRLPFALPVAAALAAGLLAGCSTYGVGIAVPVGGFGSVGVSVNSDGTVGGGVSVGTGGVSVGVGGTGRLPPPKPASAPSDGSGR